MSEWPDSMKLKPESTQEMNDVATPQGMRKRLNEYSYRGSNSMVRAIMDAARYQGMSGEDMMTWLAYEALLRVEYMTQLMIDDHMLRPMPSILFTGQKQ